MKKIVFKSLLIFAGIISVATIVGGSVFMFFYFNKSNKLIEYNVSQKETYLRQRSMSLRFETNISANKTNYHFGTTWIWGKATQNFSYYLATNIHVISPVTINENNNQSPTKENEKFQIKSGTKIALGYVKDAAVNKGDEDLNIESLNTIPSIVYTATSYNKYKYWENNNQTYNYPYSMSDLAILKFDFSNTSQNFKNFLKYYDQSPTKFNTIPIDKNFNNSEYFIGGFPYIKKEKGNGKMIGTWRFGYSSKNNKKQLVDGTINTSLPQLNSNKKPIFTNGTRFPESSNYYYKNIARQVVIQDLNLQSGSSGSMVINQNDLISGIYWGGYKFISNNKENFLGGFDALVTDGYKTINTNVTNATYPQYNRIEEIKAIIKE